MDEIELRFPVALWGVAAVCLLIAFRRARDPYPMRMVFVLPVLLLVHPVLGNLNLWVLQDEVHMYMHTEPLQANFDALLGTLGLILVMTPSYFGSIATTPAKRFDYARINRLTFWGTAICAAINVANFAAVGGITLLRPDLTGHERFTVSEQMPLPRVLAISSALLAIDLIALLGRKRWGGVRGHLLCAPINVVMAAGIGSRHLVLLPVLVAFLYAAFVKRVRTRWIVAALISLPILSNLTQTLRGDIEPEILTSYGGEYRDYLLLDGEFQFRDFQHGATLLPVVTNAIPKQVFAVAGVDKADLAKYSAYIAQDVWGADVGIRTGIWGEFYMNWGRVGVIAGLIVFGLLAGALDRSMLTRRHDEPAMLLLAFAASMMLFAVIGSWGSIGDTIGVYGVFFYVVSRIRSNAH